MRSSAALVAALLAVGSTVVACDDRSPVPSGGETAPSGDAPPDELPAARRGDRHARAAARHAPRLREVSGSIVRADGRRVTLRTGGGPELTLRIGPDTRVTIRGRRSSPRALRAGDDVRASYRSLEGGPATALSVDVAVPPPAVPPPAAAQPAGAPPASPPAVEGSDWG